MKDVIKLEQEEKEHEFMERKMMNSEETTQRNVERVMRNVKLHKQWLVQREPKWKKEKRRRKARNRTLDFEAKQVAVKMQRQRLIEKFKSEQQEQEMRQIFNAKKANEQQIAQKQLQKHRIHQLKLQNHQRS